MSFAFTSARRPRRLGLAPMIDVVFLLLVFFMLVARLNPQAEIALIPQEAGAGDYLGPPRLIALGAGGEIALNGTVLPAEDLPRALAELMQRRSDPIVIQTGSQAIVQELVTVLGILTRAGLTNVIVVP